MSKKIKITSGAAPCEIIVGEPIAKFAAAFRRLAPEAHQVAVISDQTVFQRYAMPLVGSLLRAGIKDPFVLGVPDGEKSKSLSRVEKLYGWFAKKRIER